MEAESEGKFAYHRSTKYFKDGKYSEVLEKCDKPHSSEKVPVFQGHLHYTGGMFYVNVRLAIDPSLAILGKRIGDLRHRLSN